MSFVDPILRIVSVLFSGGMDVTWAAVIGAFWILRSGRPETPPEGRRSSSRDAMVLFFGTVLGSALITPLKLIFAHPRPTGGPSFDTYSFPSGHAAATVIFTGLLAYLLSRRDPRHRAMYFTAAAVLSGLVAYSRVYLLAHYPTDVFAGIVWGLFFVPAWIYLTDQAA